MADIIIPSGEDIEGLNRREQKQYERDQKAKSLELYRQVRMKDLVEVIPALIDPALSSVFRQVRIQYMATQALKELLLEKGLITNEEYSEMFDTVVKKLTEERPDGGETRNSPALDEAKAASKNAGEVKRLSEVPVVQTEDEESAPRRLVD